MARPLHRSRLRIRSWSPLGVVLAMTVGITVLIGLFHFIIRIATA
ncbi:hypothetical protein [Microvirga rosea]|nr:hypothetical protein [Microvirga rosea]